MSNVPERIWLQWHGDTDPEWETGEVSEGDVSWCRDKIFRHDIEYIRADLATAALKAREAATWQKARIIQQSHLNEGYSTLMDGRVWQDAWNEAVITIGSDLADAANGITVAALESAAAQQKGSE